MWTLIKLTNDISFIDSSRDCHVTSLPMYSHIRFLSYTGDRTYTAFAIKIYRCCSKVIYSSHYQFKYNLVKHLCRKSILTVPLQVASFYTILAKTRCERIFDLKIIYILLLLQQSSYSSAFQFNLVCIGE